MTNKDEIITKLVKEHEGGYVNHPADRGGPTKYGITLATLRSYYGDHKLGADAVAALTFDEAKSIYHKLYWANGNIDGVPEPLRAVTFDMVINHGIGGGVRILQTGLRELLKDRPRVDGEIGPRTGAACRECLNQFGLEKTMESIVNSRKDFYNWIIMRDPSQKVFRDGWLRRAESFLMSAVAKAVKKPVNVRPSKERSKK